MKKLITLFLLCGMLLSTAACASDSGTSGNDTTADTTAAEAADTTAADDPNEAEVGTYNFDGDEFHMYTRTTYSTRSLLDVPESTADVLDDAIYERNRNLEDRFNFVYAESSMDYSTEVARTAVLAGDNTYDMISTRCVTAFNYAAEGLVTPITDIPVIDLEKNYWDKALNESLTVLGKRYFAVGEFNLTSYDFTHILLFNKEVANDFSLGDFYSMVRDGKWTYDAYFKACQAVTSDINGDGNMDTDDRYGYLAMPKQVLPNFWISAGLLSVDKNSDDIPTFTMKSDTRFFDVVERLFTMHWDDGIWMPDSVKDGDIDPEHLSMFENAQSLFVDCSFFHVNSLRSMEADFGILPYPKWDDAQDDYLSRIEGCELFCIPVTNDTLEMTGVILETMACESAKTVIPAYYDISLQTKIARDDDSSEMLDIIFNNRVFDWGDTIWCPEIRDGVLQNMFAQNDRDLASKIAALEPTVEAKIKTTVETFEGLD